MKVLACVSVLIAAMAGGCSPRPEPDCLRYDYHTNFKATQAKIRTPEEGFSLWMKRHNDLKARVRKGPVDLLWIGDSIVFRWERAGRKEWEEFYGSRRAAQIGSSGDCTDHILWRLQNGGVAGAKPKLTILLIGTNNTGLRRDPPDQTAYGIEAIVKELKKRIPGGKILLLAIFPRGNAEMLKTNTKYRARAERISADNGKVNEIIKTYADDKTVFYLDIGHVFLDADGHVDKKLMPDYVHPGPEGFRAWAEAMEPVIKKHLGE